MTNSMSTRTGLKNSLEKAESTRNLSHPSARVQTSAPLSESIAAVAEAAEKYQVHPTITVYTIAIISDGKRY